jgi:hypothetical protein
MVFVAPTPHGGRLVNLVVDEERAGMLKELSFSLADISLNERQLWNLELLAANVMKSSFGDQERGKTVWNKNSNLLKR